MAEAVSRMTGKPGLCIGTLGPGMANIAGAMMCAKVENSPVIFLGGQRPHHRAPRAPRPHPIRPAGTAFAPSVKYSASIEYADQTDEIIREAIRRAMSGTPGPSYIEYPRTSSSTELDVPDPLPPNRYRLVNQGAGTGGGRGREADSRGREPDSAGGTRCAHVAHQAAVKELADLMACPVIQTSGGTSFIPGLEGGRSPTASRRLPSKPS